MKKKARRERFYREHSVRVRDFGIPLRWGLYIDDRWWEFEKASEALYALWDFSNLPKKKFEALRSKRPLNIIHTRGVDLSWQIPIRYRQDIV